MKKLVLSLAMVLFCAVSVSAAVQEFDTVKVDVPEGWTTQAQGPVVMMMAPDMASVFTVIVAPAEGKSAEALATEAAAPLNGSAPVKEGDSYRVDFENQGQKGVMLIRVDRDQAIISTFAGGDAATMRAIAGSVQLK